MSEENIDEFADYIKEQKDILEFDSETCPVCGINLSGNLSTNPIPLIELKFENEKSATNAIEKIENAGIAVKQSSSQKDVVLVAEQKLEEVKKILND